MSEVAKSGNANVARVHTFEQPPVLFVDDVTQLGHVSGVIYVGFGAGFLDYGKPATLPVANIRMSVAFAQTLRDHLTLAIDAALAPVDRSQAN